MGARVLLTLAIVWMGAVQPRSLVREVQASTDVSWLERLCNTLDFAEAEYADRGRNTAGVKGVRSAAYVRLGELGTPESLAAVARIESAHRGQSVLPRGVVPGGWLYHPAPHMSDSRWRVEAPVRLPNGTDAAAFVLEFYGSRSLFIATTTNGRYGRPRLVQPEVQRFATVTLRDLGGKRLRAEFAPPSGPGMKLPPVPRVPDAIEFNLSDVELDSDSDGWTDIEEDWLGTNRGSADSDGDGFRDGSDSTPTFAPPRGQAEPADAVLLRRALFAMFGLTGASHALFVRDQSVRLQLTNLPGPVLYWNARGGVQVTWKILSKSDAEATVEITDYEGPLAASGNQVTLRRIGAEWYVVRIRMLWIS